MGTFPASGAYCARHDEIFPVTGACPACADEPANLPPATRAAILKILDDANGECETWSSIDALAYAADREHGIVLPPPASGNPQEWRDLCTAQSAEIEALRGSLERALNELSLERMYASIQADLLLGLRAQRLSTGWERLPCVTEGARLPAPPVSTNPLHRAIGAPQRQAVGLMTERGV